MTNPKIQTTTVNGYRHYKHPNIKNLSAPSVTSIIDMLPAPFLRQWNSKMTANAAVDNIQYVNELILANKQDKAKLWLKAAPERELAQLEAWGLPCLPRTSHPLWRKQLTVKQLWR